MRHLPRRRPLGARVQPPAGSAGLGHGLAQPGRVTPRNRLGSGAPYRPV